jgi:ADP-ribosylglycohydrolase
VPYEFKSAQEIPAWGLIDMTPPADYKRSWANAQVPTGTWSDDGALTLALLDSLTRKPDLDLEDFMARALDWELNAAYTPDSRQFGTGRQTTESLRLFKTGVAAIHCGVDREDTNGNGALMRAIACVLAPAANEDALIDRALRQGVPTHAHAWSRATCALYVLTAWRMGASGLAPEQALASASQQLRFRFKNDKPLHAALELLLQHHSRKPQGSGFVLDSFWSAWHALERAKSFEDVIRHAIQLGGDTDTTACIAGGLAGLVYGEQGMPARWLEQLQGRDYALSFLDL